MKDLCRIRIYGLLDSLFEVIGNILAFFGVMDRPKPPTNLRLDGQTVIVTGGNRGIGRCVARDVASRGARVIIACRDVRSGEAAANAIMSCHRGAIVDVRSLDLSNIESIKAFCQAIIAEEPRVDVLVNNAGILMQGRAVTSKGWEMMLAVNYIGLVYLTMTLKDKMVQSSPDPRIVSVSSMAHAMAADVDWTDLSGEKNSRFWIAAYGASKLALIWFSQELALREAESGLRVYAVDPGTSQTNLFDNVHPAIHALATTWVVRPTFRTVESSADSVVHAIVQPKHLYNRQSIYMQDGRIKTPTHVALDQDKRINCWSETMKIINQH